MGKPNVSRQALVEAIATLEAQRGPAGDGRDLDRAVDTVLSALREKLAQLQAEPGDRQRRQLAVLIADLSGFTALSEHMDAEKLSDAINSMWGVLDAVIQAWGGWIDQHAGDSLMAVFGLPNPRQGDTARALHAALAMQQELVLFNERARRMDDEPLGMTWAGDWPGPSMRIGVHSGAVYYARASNVAAIRGDRMTALGETVAEARRMEKLAPEGGVLASAVAARQAQNHFTFGHATDGSASPGLESGDAFVVEGERPAAADYQPGVIAGQVTRWVGREEQLERLELALQTTIDSRTPQLVTIVGPPGVGKSRLVHEFLRRARLMSGSATILRAEPQGAHRDSPFALVRDLLLRRFNLYPQDSRYLIEHKLRRGLAEFGQAGADGIFHAAEPSGRTMRLLQQLIDVPAARALSVDDALAGVSSLLRAIAAAAPVIVLLEGVDRADERSLELIHRLAHEPAIGPILFLAVSTEAVATETHTTNPAARFPSLGPEDDVFSSFVWLDVPPLTAVESRLMATQILSPLSPRSIRIAELVVVEAMGNPLYIESYIQMLIERGIVMTGERWRVDMARAEAMTLTPDLSKLIETRLSYLPDIERIVLRHAAVYGSICWDNALLETIPVVDFTESEIEAAILSLEIKHYLLRDDIYSFAATQAHVFRREAVRDAVYHAIPESERRALHLQAAHWLVANEREARLSGRLPIDAMIARHFAAAGDSVHADAWHRRAGLAEGAS